MSGAGDGGQGAPAPQPSPPGTPDQRSSHRGTILAALLGAVALLLVPVVQHLLDSGPAPGGSAGTVVTSPATAATHGPSAAHDTGGGPTTTPPDDPRSSAPPGPGDTDSTPPGAPGLSQAEQNLARRTATGDLSGCRHADPGAYASVALNCDSARGPDTDPLVLSFDDADRMRSWMIDELSTFTVSDSGACEDRVNYSGYWYRDNNAEGGMVACHWGNGVYRIAWFYQDQLVGAVAEGSDAKSLVEWWASSPVDL